MKLKLTAGLFTTLIIFSSHILLAMPFPVAAPVKQFYQLIIYHLKDKQQEDRVDQYLSTAYIPAAHRAGIKTVGIFKNIGIDTAVDKKIYVLLPYSSLAEFNQISRKLESDKDLLSKGADYVNAAFDNIPYLRKESILMEAFTGAPVLKKPSFDNTRNERVYELRSYEGPTEKLYRNKLSMFNDANEMEIFERIGSQPVFYGEVLAGSRMPNLMYMTTYSDKKSRDEHWKTFGNDPRWKELSAKPEYQHNVSKAVIDFLFPTDYSDF